ncbi:MAG TPA: hypothetical protein VGF16_03490, partial [Bryobacteraceae bacterium]
MKPSDLASLSDASSPGIRASDRPSRRRGTPDWGLVGVTLVAAAPILYLAATQYVEYDGFWHVFIARQDQWRNFWFQWQNSNSHPPLYFLILRFVAAIGQSALWYRAISVISGVASVYLVGMIAGKLSRWQFTHLVTALAFGLAIPMIEVSIAVRSYMLGVFFVLFSFYYFLDLLSENNQATVKPRVLFALYAILAVGSAYFAIFYVAACAGVLGIVCLARTPTAWKTWLSHALT